jgi:(1->4)-alpha-D-glucan 1-alpha-D-glucosylmutase
LGDSGGSSLRVPTATYRLQLRPGFGFREARAIVPYLQDLGVSHLYLSPVFAARRASVHGYDLTDPTRLNPELGSAADFRALSDAVVRRGMGLLLDIVPNHMAASSENAWWADVLANGRESPYAPFFDIDWDAGDGRVVLPILGRLLAEAIASRDLRVVVDEGGAGLRYFETRLPLRLPDGADPSELVGDRLAAVLAAQAYELVHWREAPSRVNYRRFFDVNDLVGVRVEEAAVFDATHAMVLRLVREGRVGGLRLDHVDGLREPLAYLRRLVDATGGREGVYLVVEKVLLGDETLPPRWPVDGTTGYDFQTLVGGLFVDPAGLRQLDAAYRRLTDLPPIDEVTYQRKRDGLRDRFPGELRRLAAALLGTDAGLPVDRPSLEDLVAALIEVTAGLPVYRTYLTAAAVPSATDRRYLGAAVAAARRRGAAPRPALDFLGRVLADPAGPALAGVLRWQQLSGAAMAKGLEDSAFYIYNRLVSQNDVGASATSIETPTEVAAFHAWAARRRRRWPDAMNATSTHDSKRSEDVRARISVLSERPASWLHHLARWRRLNAGHRRRLGRRYPPDANEEMLFYQTLVGVWPLDGAVTAAFVERLQAYMLKAAREAGVHTSWLDPRADHEAALADFVAACLDGERSAAFLADFAAFQSGIALPGAVGSLAQTLIKLTAPGLPDLYQGNELWDLSLVDPDNRRPVDYEERRRQLTALQADPVDLGALLRSWQDGRLKLLVTTRALQLRRDRPALFQRGAYLPLAARGRRADRIIAFARRRSRRWALTVVPRLASQLAPTGLPLGRRAWHDDKLLLPRRAPLRWRNLLSDERLTAAATPDGPALALGEVLARLPVALLVEESRGRSR